MELYSITICGLKFYFEAQVSDEQCNCTSFLFTFIDGLWRKMIYVYLLKDIKELFYDTYTACYEGNTDGLVALIYNLYGINLNKDTLELTLKRLPTSEDKITVIKSEERFIINFHQ